MRQVVQDPQESQSPSTVRVPLHHRKTHLPVPQLQLCGQEERQPNQAHQDPFCQNEKGLPAAGLSDADLYGNSHQMGSHRIGRWPQKNEKTTPITLSPLLIQSFKFVSLQIEFLKQRPTNQDRLQWSTELAQEHTLCLSNERQREKQILAFTSCYMYGKHDLHKFG